MADENILLIAVKLAGTAKAEGELQALSGEIKAVGNEAVATSKKSKALAFNAGLLGTGLGKLYHYGKLGAAGLLASGIASAVAGSNFEQQMAAVHSVTNANLSDMKRLSDTALHEATITRFSATQAAEGMYRLGRAGFSANQVLAAIPGTLNLAHASAIDMATAAQIQAETLRAFGLQAGQAGMVADVLAKATQGGAMSMQDLGDAMKYMGATAFGTGQNLQGMVGLLKAMALHAVRGSTAGTTLRQALSRLVNPQKQTAKGLALMGIEAHDLYDSKGLKGLPVILDTMYNKLRLLDPVSRKTAISQAFGIHALGGMMALFNQGPKKWDMFISQMNNSAGTAQHMADILNNTVQMKLLRFWHTLEAIGIRMFLMFSPQLGKLITRIDDSLGKYADSFNAISQLAGGPGNAVLWILDAMFHAHGRLIRVGHTFERGLRTTWTFVQTVLLPIAIQWAKIFAGALYIAAGALVRIMGFFNHHTRLAKFIIGLLIVAYINWKIITLTVLAVQKVAAAWMVLMKFRMIAMYVATKAITIATKAYAVAQWLLNVAMDANIIVLVVAALVLLAVGLYLAYKHVKWFRDAVNSTWRWIKTYWPYLVGFFLGPIILVTSEIIAHWSDITYFFTHFGSSMGKIGNSMWDWLKKGFADAKKWIVNELNSLFNIIHDNWPDVPGLPGPGFGRNPFGGGGGGATPGMTLQTGGPGALAFVNRYAGANPLAASPSYVQSPANTSSGFLAPRVVDPITPNPDNPLFAAQDPLFHATFTVDGKVLVDATARAKSDKRARRGG